MIGDGKGDSKPKPRPVKKYNNRNSKNYNPKFLPKITKDYMTYKIKLENIIKKEFGNKSKILRLPIIFGFESPRIQYYVDRIFLNRQIIQSKNFRHFINNLARSNASLFVNYYPTI